MLTRVLATWVPAFWPHGMTLTATRWRAADLTAYLVHAP
jgi:hypothetical protein